MKTPLAVAAALVVATPGLALADEATGYPPIVVRYTAPPECPSAETFTSAVAAELTGHAPVRPVSVAVTVAITRGDRGYVLRAQSSSEGGPPLERIVEAPTCDEATEVAAAVIALAQVDSGQATPTAPPSAPAPAIPKEASTDTPANDVHPPSSPFSYSVSLGYGSFTAGPAEPVIVGYDEQTTFNPARGVRLGFEIAHTIGAWKHSLQVSAAYYRQSSSTVSIPSTGAMPESGKTSEESTDISDRDVLHATIDACPLHVEYAFVSLIPCATFSMIQSRGTSGNDPELETGLGGDVHLRAAFATRFFAEALGAAVAHTSSYEPVTRDVRLFYALSLGMSFR